MGGRWTVRIVVIRQRYKLNDNAKNDNRNYTDNNDNDSHFIAGLHGATIIYIYIYGWQLHQKYNITSINRQMKPSDLAEEKNTKRGYA